MKETIQNSYIMASPKTFVALSKHSLSKVSVQPCTLSRAKNVPNILQLPWKPYKYEMVSFFTNQNTTAASLNNIFLVFPTAVLTVYFCSLRLKFISRLLYHLKEQFANK